MAIGVGGLGLIFQAGAKDATRLDEFLSKHTETSMFLRSNLLRFGIDQSDHAHAMRYFVEEFDGKIAGVGAISNSGMLMIQAPDGIDNITEYMMDVIPEKNEISGVLGDFVQVNTLSTALNLDDLPVILDGKQPLMSLQLDDLTMPDIEQVQLRVTENIDLPLVTKWRHVYLVETMESSDTSETQDKARGQAVDMIKSGYYRILERDGAPISFTGFNATVPDTVQIGGVFTPPELRSNGFARKAVALHLQEAKKNGVKRAILFASGEPAKRAYQGIGFEQIGHFTLKLFDQGNT